jgi:hypothetical protein
LRGGIEFGGASFGMLSFVGELDIAKIAECPHRGYTALDKLERITIDHAEFK